MRKQKQIIQILVMLMVLLTPMLLMAQPESNPYSGGSTSDPDAAPIDGGLSLLVAAGIGYGAKKLKEKRNTSIVLISKKE